MQNLLYSGLGKINLKNKLFKLIVVQNQVVFAQKQAKKNSLFNPIEFCVQTPRVLCANYRDSAFIL